MQLQQYIDYLNFIGMEKDEDRSTKNRLTFIKEYDDKGILSVIFIYPEKQTATVNLFNRIQMKNQPPKYHGLKISEYDIEKLEVVETLGDEPGNLVINFDAGKMDIASSSKFYNDRFEADITLTELHKKHIEKLEEEKESKQEN